MPKRVVIKSTAKPVGKHTVRVTTSITTGNATRRKTTYVHGR